MNKFIVSLFLVFVSMSIYDTTDPKKALLVLEYNDGSSDRILLDKKTFSNHDSIYKVIDQILTFRKTN